jgi:hypothetical protein
MRIVVEFVPDLALREFGSSGRDAEECLPEKMEEGKIYSFLKKGQRNYWLSDDPNWGFGQIQLCETTGGESLSRPLASVKILEVVHFLKDGRVWTRGKYKVIEIFDKDDATIHFEGCRRVR